MRRQKVHYLPDDAVKAILRRNTTVAQIAEVLKVPQDIVLEIIRRRRWRWPKGAKHD